MTADRGRVLVQPGATLTAAQVFERLPNQPVVTIAGVVADFGVTKPTAGRAVDALVAAGVLVEMTGRKRDRRYGYGAYLRILRAGTEL